jgi:hypothetical protein
MCLLRKSNIDKKTKITCLYKLWFFCLIKSRKFKSRNYFEKFKHFFEKTLGKLYLFNDINNSLLRSIITTVLIDPMVQQTTTNLPENFFVNIDNIVKSWTLKELTKISANHGNQNYYIDNILLIMFSKFLKEFFNNKTVLDIGSGNGASLNIVKQSLKNCRIKFILSDPINNQCNPENKKHNCIDALNFYNEIDTFTIMSPSPSSIDNSSGKPYICGGGFEIIFIEELLKQRRNFQILIIGELGAGDGISGSHSYLFYNKKLTTTILYIHEIEDKFIDLNCRKTKMIYLVKSNY